MIPLVVNNNKKKNGLALQFCHNFFHILNYSFFNLNHFTKMPILDKNDFDVCLFHINCCNNYTFWIDNEKYYKNMQPMDHLK